MLQSKKLYYGFFTAIIVCIQSFWFYPISCNFAPFIILTMIIKNVIMLKVYANVSLITDTINWLFLVIVCMVWRKPLRTSNKYHNSWLVIKYVAFNCGYYYS